MSDHNHKQYQGKIIFFQVIKEIEEENLEIWILWQKEFLRIHFHGQPNFAKNHGGVQIGNCIKGREFKLLDETIFCQYEE